ncbi:uncharacterized protein LOC143373955 [Andrena cerasifolii]|uniref:uncharacterized protein LOC143373955 n=1 Tax=Andrena cerasifolii TaxID=2819439 RepID=UPI0040384D49
MFPCKHFSWRGAWQLCDGRRKVKAYDDEYNRRKVSAIPRFLRKVNEYCRYTANTSTRLRPTGTVMLSQATRLCAQVYAHASIIEQLSPIGYAGSNRRVVLSQLRAWKRILYETFILQPSLIVWPEV